MEKKMTKTNSPEWPDHAAEEAEAVAWRMEQAAQREDRRRARKAAERRRAERAAWYNSPEQVALRAARAAENAVKQEQAQRVQQIVLDSFGRGLSTLERFEFLREWSAGTERTDFERYLVNDYIKRETVTRRVMYGEDI